MQRPNVLFLISDQHNAKCLGHVGHPEVQTPHMDRLAAEGTRFTRCTTANPICTPSRMSFLSGQYCHNHGYYGLSGPNPGGLPNLFGHFRRFGYRTAAMGKIHCPEYWVEDDCDVFHETCGCSRDGRSPRYHEHLLESGWEEEEEHTGYPEFGKTSGGRQKMDGRASKLPFHACQEGWIANTGSEFIRDCQAEERPFIMQCSFPRPHQVAAPCQEFWDLYDTDSLQLPPSCDADLTGKAPHLLATRQYWRNDPKFPLFEPKTFAAARQRKLHSYYGAISQVDAAVGVLLQTLDELGIADNTIVIYTSDHGDYAAEFDVMEKAPGICSDAITRIPSIWRGPGIVAGQERDQHVESIDLSQTVCDLAGVDPLSTSDGTSMRPLLEEGAEPVWGKSHGVTEFAWSKSIRQGDWRLVTYPREMFAEEYPDGFGELYDLATDPWEMRNLYFDAEQQERVQALQRELYDWLITSTRPVSVLGTKAPDRQHPQVQHRFSREVLADRKMDPRWIADRWTSNYL